MKTAIGFAVESIDIYASTEAINPSRCGSPAWLDPRAQ
jgi:hypothetical protein